MQEKQILIKTILKTFASVTQCQMLTLKENKSKNVRKTHQPYVHLYLRV